MSSKRPKGTFQDRYNKPESAIPPDLDLAILKSFISYAITLFLVIVIIK